MKKVKVLLASLLIITSMTTLSFSSNAYNINDRTDSIASSSARSGSNYKMLFLYLNSGTSLSSELMDYDNVNTYVISPDGGYHVTYDWNMSKHYYDYIDYIGYVKKYVDYIVSHRQTKNNKIFIATPSSFVNGKQQSPNSSNIKAFFADLRANFSDEVWNNNIEGIYVYDEEYTDNGKYHKNVGDIMHSNSDYRNKKLLWCPYYGVYGEISHVLRAYPNLFDIILIQPNYYFGGKDVLDKIKGWIETQKVNGVSSRNTVLGVQLEIDIAYTWRDDRVTSYGTTAEYCKNAYNKYFSTFESVKTLYPMSHFGDSWKPNLTNRTIINKINDFYAY